ncbi:MAG: CAP domain-containing protein [Defluviitaleaceae bacterium]|nr:CAP domain-containing protein [Defluviitaleaceae bacterium]
MKRIIKTAVVFVILFLILPQGVVRADYQPINVTVDGVAVHFADVRPIIVADRMLVPVRGLFEHMGFYVHWDSYTDTALLSREGHNVAIRRGDVFFTVNGQQNTPDVPPQIINDRFMLPLRAIAEATGTEVYWYGATRTVVITTAPAGPQAPPAVQQPQQPAYQAWQAPFLYTTSAITLPNRRFTDAERQNWIAEYADMGGASAFELEAIRIINNVRREHGLVELQIDQGLMHASRFYAQTMSNVTGNLGHHEGPYGSSGAVADAFGASWNAANGAAGNRTPQNLVDGWMNSPGHRANILNSNLRYIGLGSQLGGDWGVFHYSLKSNNPTPQPAYAQPGQDIAASPPAQTQEWAASIVATRSARTLTNRRLTETEREEWIAEYHALGGANSFEREILTEINIIRVSHGLNELIWDDELAMASRYFTQMLTDLSFDRQSARSGAMHSFGPYGGSNGIARAFGADNRSGANGMWGSQTPQSVVQGWMNSPAHRDNVLRRGVTRAGVGSTVSHFQFGVVHYFMSRGEPSVPAVPPPPPTTENSRPEQTAAQDIVMTVTSSHPSGLNVPPGEQMEFLISVTNTGPSNAVINIGHRGSSTWRQISIRLSPGETREFTRPIHWAGNLRHGHELNLEFYGTLSGQPITVTTGAYFNYMVYSNSG